MFHIAGLNCQLVAGTKADIGVSDVFYGSCPGNDPAVLVRLEGECVKALQSIRRGITMLDDRHPDDPVPASPPAPSGKDAAMSPDLPLEARVHA